MEKPIESRLVIDQECRTATTVRAHIDASSRGVLDGLGLVRRTELTRNQPGGTPTWWQSGPSGGVIGMADPNRSARRASAGSSRPRAANALGITDGASKDASQAGQRRADYLPHFWPILLFDVVGNGTATNCTSRSGCGPQRGPENDRRPDGRPPTGLRQVSTEHSNQEWSSERRRSPRPGIEIATSRH
jgi:hypothetical protein